MGRSRWTAAVDSMIHLVVSSGMSRMIRCLSAPENRMSPPVVNLATRKRSRSRLRLLPYRHQSFPKVGQRLVRQAVGPNPLPSLKDRLPTLGGRHFAH